MNSIEIVPTEFVHQAWHYCSKFILDAMKHAKGECTAEQLLMQLAQGSNLLMLYREDDEIVGAVVGYFITAPNARIFYINAIGGKTSEEHTQKMFEYAKANGATRVRGSARESVARLWRMKYGFESIYTTVEKVL